MKKPRPKPGSFLFPKLPPGPSGLLLVLDRFILDSFSSWFWFGFGLLTLTILKHKYALFGHGPKLLLLAQKLVGLGDLVLQPFDLGILGGQFGLEHLNQSVVNWLNRVDNWLFNLVVNLG